MLETLKDPRSGFGVSAKEMLVRNSEKELLEEPVLFDMTRDDKDKQALIDAGKMRFEDVGKITIKEDIEASRYDIDIAKMRHDYLFRENKKKNWLSFLKRKKH